MDIQIDVKYDSSKFTMRDNLEIQRRLIEFGVTLTQGLPDTLRTPVTSVESKLNLEKGCRDGKASV